MRISAAVLAGLIWGLALAPLPSVGQEAPGDFIEVPAELTTELQVQAAYNGSEMHWRFRWPAAGDWYHDMLRYRDGAWQRYGSSQVGSQPQGIYEDRLTFLVNPGTVTGFEQQGCYATCHSGSRFLSDQLPSEAIADHPYLGETRGKSDLRKYIPQSRQGDTWWDAPWDEIKPQAALDRLRDNGVFLDFWHWRAHRSNPMGYADDQWVLEYRNGDGGQSPYTTNWDGDAGQPRWMFDPAQVGDTHLEWERLLNKAYDQQDDTYAITTANSVPFDPDHGWENGDVIPRRLVRVPEGSRGTIRAEGTWENGEWTLSLRRAMDPGYPRDDHALLEGRTYSMGFAVHKDANGSRWHYISHPQRVGIGVPGDIQAVRFRGVEPDWSQVPTQTLHLWYPAQITWEWLTSDQHPGAPEVRSSSRACADCHGSDAAAALKIAQASVYQERSLVSSGLNWWLTLVAVLAVLVLGTFAAINFTRR